MKYFLILALQMFVCFLSQQTQISCHIENKVIFHFFQVDGEEEKGEVEATGGSKAQLILQTTRERWTPTQTVPDMLCNDSLK